MATISRKLPYRQRLVDPLVDSLFAQLPALLVVGPRAAGKSRTSERRAEAVVRLDREQEAVAFEADPDAALRDTPEPALLDEWQAVPGVLGAVRRAVDADPRAGRFLLTGSVRATVQNETWPATGRVVRLAMFPMSMREQLGDVSGPSFFDRLAEGEEPRAPSQPPDLRGYLDMALRSGFPEPALALADESRRVWLESYIDDLLTHDIEQLEEPVTRRRDSVRLRRYLEAYALNSAGAADHRTIYEAAGVSKATAAAYEELLDGLLIAERLPAWTSNRLRRLARRPKRYLVDPALVAAALRIDARDVMRDGDLLGRILDTFVVAQLRPELAISATRPRLHHLRTAQGRHEIDLVAELAGGRLIAIEVKASAAPRADAAHHLRWLRDELGDRFLAGIVLHTGPHVYRLGERIHAAPIGSLWS
jgi:predicted AAA+ superfamily ATPase